MQYYNKSPMKIYNIKNKGTKTTSENFELKIFNDYSFVC